jgi:hypothetical protein
MQHCTSKLLMRAAAVNVGCCAVCCGYIQCYVGKHLLFRCFHTILRRSSTTFGSLDLLRILSRAAIESAAFRCHTKAFGLRRHPQRTHTWTSKLQPHPTSLSYIEPSNLDLRQGYHPIAITSIYNPAQ